MEEERQEKRAVPRLKREISVQYRIKKAPPIEGVQVVLKPQLDITRTKDLSENGICFTTSHAISLQSTLEIKLQLPIQRNPVALVGQVLGCEEVKENIIYRIRVEFINLNDRQRKVLQDFVRSFGK